MTHSPATPSSPSDTPLEQPARRQWLGQVGALSAGLATAATAGAAPLASASPTAMGLKTPALQRVRWGVIGVGQRGSFLTQTLCAIDGADVVAIADPDPKSVERTLKLIAGAKRPAPQLYTNGPDDWRKMIARQDLDAILVVTPWQLHTPMAVAAMEAGKHAFVEVPAATSIEECWQLVNTSERTRKHCMMLENVCYGREELMLLNMARSGLLGDMLHGEAAYIHDLRWQIKEIERSTGSWRTLWHTTHNGNLYPTHGLGPIAQCFGVNRGDRFEYINSQSSPAVTFAQYSQREFPAGHPRNQLKYINGDVNTSLIKCASGRTIMLQHDTNTPRPYTRLNMVVGSNGTFAGFPNRIAVEFDQGKEVMAADGKSEAFHRWDMEMKGWYERFDHPLWKKLAEDAARNGGHGGMDFVMLWRAMWCLQHGEAMDQDVYDAAAWSSVMPLSCASVKDRGNAKDFPDFTRGAWKDTPPLAIVS